MNYAFEISKRVYPQSTVKHVGERMLYVLRYLKCLPQSRQWVELLASEPLAGISEVNPSLYKKIVRPYVGKSWSNERKLQALRTNYRFWLTVLRPPAFHAMFTFHGLIFCTFQGKDDDCFSLRFCYDTKFNKEGELTLELLSSRHHCRISALAFHVGADPSGQFGILVGALQGLEAGIDKDFIKEVSKAMHGLRPKALLLHVVQEIAGAFDLRFIRGISNQEHISQHIGYRLNRSRRFHLTYDEFWQEMGGVLLPDGFFELPLRSSYRDPSAIKSNKRSLYRHRYEMLERLQTCIRASLVTLGRGAPSEALSLSIGGAKESRDFRQLPDAFPNTPFQSV